MRDPYDALMDHYFDWAEETFTDSSAEEAGSAAIAAAFAGIRAGLQAAEELGPDADYDELMQRAEAILADELGD